MASDRGVGTRRVRGAGRHRAARGEKVRAASYEGPGKLDARAYQLTSSAVALDLVQRWRPSADTVFFCQRPFLVVMKWQTADRKALQEFMAALEKQAQRRSSTRHYNGRTPMSSSAIAAATPEMIARYEPVIGLEVHVQLATRDEDFLRLPHRLRRAAEYQRLPGVPGAARRAAGAEPRARWNWRSRARWR